MYQAYRVLRPFRWRGWHFGPEGRHLAQEVNQDTGEPALCDCPDYAGHVFVVEEGHPRKGWALEQRKVRGDVTLRPSRYATDDDWIAATPDLERLTRPPEQSMAGATPPGHRRVKAGALA